MKIRNFFITFTVLLCTSILETKGAYVGFGESDYHEIEGTKYVDIVVQKHGVNTDSVILTLTSKLIHELHEENGDGMDPAEYEQDGKKDFHQVDKIVVFAPSDGYIMEKTFTISFHNDDINEPYEGFFLVLTINELNKEKDVAFIPGGNVTLIRIHDDDDITLSFEKPRYDVTEQDIELKDLIYVVKEGNKTTEQILEVFVMFSQNVGTKYASRGEDFDLEDFTVLTFQPDIRKLPIPFRLFQDEIAEQHEKFRLYLSIPQHSALYSLGSIPATDVYIHDDDDTAVIGFESTVYTTEESSGSVEVCVAILSPLNGTSSVITGKVQSVDREATSEEDYHSVLENIYIDGDHSRHCFDVVIINDASSEAVEEFELELTLDKTHISESLSVIASPNETIVIIQDDDQLSVDISPVRCNPNADLIQISDSERRCLCRAGYEGDGIRHCRDVDECRIKADNCDVNALCTNTRGSFECTCQLGFTGNGRICEECTLGTHDCSGLATCVNTHGSYTCRCNDGFTGSGKFCIDINECVSRQHNCDLQNGYCVNTWGSYTCRCKAGFQGDGTNCVRIESDQTPQPRSRSTRTRSRSRSKSRRTKSRKSKSNSRRTRTRHTHSKSTRS